MFLKLLPALLLAFQIVSAGENHYLLMGGGGEGEGKDTIFDIEIQNAGKFIEQSQTWRPETNFNGGHEDTEKILRDNFGKKGAVNSPFNSHTFEQNIKRYEEKLLNGDIGPGDQLLIHISSHGALKTEEEKTHSISSSNHAPQDLNNLEGTSTVSLDSLQKLSDLARDKGVKLAILDSSCHSGASLSLANDNTCVITSTGPNHFSWGKSSQTFSAKFTENLQTGRSLEEVFLKAVKDKASYPAFPMISTSVGVNLQNELYPLLSPFLYNANGKTSQRKFSKFLENEAWTNRCAALPNQFEELLLFSKEMEEVAKGGFLWFKPNFSKFREAVSEYFEIQKDLVEKMGRIDPEFLKEKEKFCHDYTTGIPPYSREMSRCHQWSRLELASMDFDVYIDLLKDQKEESVSETLSRGIEANIQIALDAQKRAQELLQEDTALARYKNFFEAMPDIEKRSKDLSFEITKEYQSLYTKVYEAQSEDYSGPNPCRDFKL